ncbi:MAG: DUF3553 domain-containing protein [Phycisphaera sp.]|nr:DUF3553 domain-containing protein [Phycisphaera sp.]
MTTPSTLRQGDTVYHVLRPEWGKGTVNQAARITHEGKPAQRVVITFANHGRVTLNTAIASLVTQEPTPTVMNTPNTERSFPSSAGHPSKNAPGSVGGGWLGSLGEKSHDAAELYRLPEAMTDPFASQESRLVATLSSYRFSTEPRSLIEWAVAQTHLDDPLSKYTRPVLEQGFYRFCRDRDNHLLDMVRNLKRNNQHAMLHQIAHKTALPAARNALAKAMKA